MEKKYQSLNQIQDALRSGQTNCKEVVSHYLEQIELHNEELNAFLEVYATEAMLMADALDQKLEAGQKMGRLFGMTIGIKDVICYKGHKVTAASRILENFESIYNATCVDRLLQEDAIILGRLNCDEFAMGSSSENSAFGPIRNADDPSKVPGGSSGGSAVAVQADMCLAALGSDTGGSVRQPASFCNVVGLKPSYGRISRHGLIAYASSFDIIGTLSNTIEDARILLDVMAGPDDFDSTTIQNKWNNTAKQVEAPKIAYFPAVMNHQGLDPEIKEKVEEFLGRQESKGAIVEPVDFPYLDYLVPTYYILTTAEASSNLARYDGAHYGHRSSQASSIEEMYRLSRTEAIGEEVRRRIMLGTFVLSAGHYDAYFTKAQKVRRLIADKTLEILSQYDFIVTPTTPTTAFPIDAGEYRDPISMYLADIYTVQANLAGVPAISLPLFQHSNGMPFGIQLLSGKFDEQKLLTYGQELMLD